VARHADEVPRLAREVGFPLAAKVVSEDLPHKSDVGGVVLGLRDEAASAEAFAAIHAAVRREVPTARVDGVLLQRMELGLREVFLGGRQDPCFGPVVTVGLGGVAVELFRDVSLRLAPVTARDIEDMLSEVTSFRAFRGHRGLPAADLEFLRSAVARMAQLVVAYPEIESIDLNPLKLHRAGRAGCVVDARVVLAAPAGRAPGETLR
jgi:acetyltransferase